ncbi:MAG TPA: LPS export ABC transporter periplasmic protein LptC, partial [Usitatibacter sp.]
VIVRNADAKNEAVRLTTDKLLVIPDEGIARTDTEVTMQSKSTSAVAAALELDNHARTLKLDRVRAVIKPRR